MFRLATLFLGLSLGALLAAGVDGKWSGERKFQTPDGEERTMTTTLELKSEGNTLTGKMSAGPRGEAEIQDGKVDGNKISFTTKMSTPRGEFTSHWEGTVSGDEMTLTRQGGPGGGRGGKGGGKGPGGPLTLKRVQ
jgi:hypothetical protein